MSLVTLIRVLLGSLAVITYIDLDFVEFFGHYLYDMNLGIRLWIVVELGKMPPEALNKCIHIIRIVHSSFLK